jgi:hypothetical protein
MINVSHWSAPQFLLVLFLFIWTGLDQKALHQRVSGMMKREAVEYPAIVQTMSTLGALIVPVVVLCLTCWGGFFA